LTEKDRKDTKSKRDGGNTLMNDESKDLKRAQLLAAIQQAQASTDPKTFEIEISNPFFSGPSTITLTDAAANKTHAVAPPQGKGKDAGKGHQAEHNSSNMLVLNSNP